MLGCAVPRAAPARLAGATLLLPLILLAAAFAAASAEPHGLYIGGSNPRFYPQTRLVSLRNTGGAAYRNLIRAARGSSGFYVLSDLDTFVRGADFDDRTVSAKSSAVRFKLSVRSPLLPRYSNVAPTSSLGNDIFTDHIRSVAYLPANGTLRLALSRSSTRPVSDIALRDAAGRAGPAWRGGSKAGAVWTVTFARTFVVGRRYQVWYRATPTGMFFTAVAPGSPPPASSSPPQAASSTASRTAEPQTSTAKPQTSTAEPLTHREPQTSATASLTATTATTTSLSRTSSTRSRTATAVTTSCSQTSSTRSRTATTATSTPVPVDIQDPSSVWSRVGQRISFSGSVRDYIPDGVFEMEWPDANGHLYAVIPDTSTWNKLRLVWGLDLPSFLKIGLGGYSITFAGLVDQQSVCSPSCVFFYRVYLDSFAAFSVPAFVRPPPPVAASLGDPNDAILANWENQLVSVEGTVQAAVLAAGLVQLNMTQSIILFESDAAFAATLARLGLSAKENLVGAHVTATGVARNWDPSPSDTFKWDTNPYVVIGEADLAVVVDQPPI